MDNSAPKSPAQAQFEKALDIASAFDDKDVAGDEIVKKRAENNVALAKKLAETFLNLSFR